MRFIDEWEYEPLCEICSEKDVLWPLELRPISNRFGYRWQFVCNSCMQKWMNTCEYKRKYRRRKEMDYKDLVKDAIRDILQDEGIAHTNGDHCTLKFDAIERRLNQLNQRIYSLRNKIKMADNDGDHKKGKSLSNYVVRNRHMNSEMLTSQEVPPELHSITLRSFAKATRVLDSLEMLGITTIGGLVDKPSDFFFRQRGIGIIGLYDLRKEVREKIASFRGE